MRLPSWTVPLRHRLLSPVHSASRATICPIGGAVGGATHVWRTAHHNGACQGVVVRAGRIPEREREREGGGQRVKEKEREGEGE